jgi:hypothetical protein
MVPATMPGKDAFAVEVSLLSIVHGKAAFIMRGGIKEHARAL